MPALNGYLALGTLNGAGVFTEIAGATGYARQPITFDVSDSGKAQNTSAVAFSKGRYFNWPKFNAYAFYSSASGGSPVTAWAAREPSDMDLYGPQPRSIGAREITVQFPASALPLTIGSVSRGVGEWIGQGLAGAQPNALILLGDSLSGNHGGAPISSIYRANGFMYWANAFLGWPFKVVSNQGIAGQTSAEIGARVGDVLALNPGWVMYEAGTNDVLLGIDIDAVTIPAQLATLKALTGAGIRVIFPTTIPSDTFVTTSSQAVAYAKLLNWQRSVARLLPGVIVADTARAVTDPATGKVFTGMLYDAIHPAMSGAGRMGQCIAAAVGPFVAKNRIASNLFDPALYNAANPGMVGSNASGTNGTNLRTGVTGVASDGLVVDRMAAGTTIVCSKLAADPADWRSETALRCDVTCTADADGVVVRFGSGLSSNSFYNTAWTAAQAVTSVDRRMPTVANGYTYRCVKAGTTGGTQPTWPIVEGSLVTDGTAIWLCQKMPAPGDVFKLVAEFTVSNVDATEGVAPFLRIVPTSATVGYPSIDSMNRSDTTRLIGFNGRMTLETPPIAITSFAGAFEQMYGSLYVHGGAGATFTVDIHRLEVIRLV